MSDEIDRTDRLDREHYTGTFYRRVEHQTQLFLPSLSANEVIAGKLESAVAEFNSCDAHDHEHRCALHAEITWLRAMLRKGSP